MYTANLFYEFKSVFTFHDLRDTNFHLDTPFLQVTCPICS